MAGQGIISVHVINRLVL